jgi:hypothetical protein
MPSPDPLTPPSRRKQEYSGYHYKLAIGGGSALGIGSGMLSATAAIRYGPSTTHDAVVTEKSIDQDKEAAGRYNTPVEISTGKTVDFDETHPEVMYDVLEPGQSLTVTISDLVGEPITADVAGVHYDLLPLTAPDFYFPAAFAVVGLATLWLWFTPRWFYWLSATAWFVAIVLLVLVFR